MRGRREVEARKPVTSLAHKVTVSISALEVAEEK